MHFWKELQRRNVFRVAAAYVVFAWLVVQVAETLLPIFEVPDVFLRGVILVLVLGFPLAIFFAWAFELTPEGVKREKEVDREHSAAPKTGRKLDRVIIVVLLLAVGYFVFDEFVLEPRQDLAEHAAAPDFGETAAQTVEDSSIAVLPFANMSEDPDNEYFADGVAEELLNLLTRVEELRVISRSSSFSFEGQNLASTEIAERLNVAHVLDGSVRKAGTRVRVAVQLVDARSDTQVWSDSWDRELDDIFAIQDEIATSVVEQLRITLLGDAPTAEQTDPEAFQFYLQAKHLGSDLNRQALDKSEALYRQALEIDPDYADAWAGVGLAFINRIAGGLMDVDQGAGEAREALEKALAIDPDHALAHSRLGGLALLIEFDLPEAARRAERALELAPGNVDVMHNAAYVPACLGQLEQSIALQELVIERDPVNPVSHANLALMYYLAGEWDKALAAFRVVLRLSPEHVGARFDVGMIHLLKGDPEAAKAAFANEQLDYQRQRGLALVAYERGNTDEFASLRTHWLQKWGETYPLQAAQLQAWSGEADATFEWLDLAVDQNATELGLQFLEQYYDPIRDDPRWMEFLRRVGSAPEQREAVDFEITLPRSVRPGE